MPRALRGVVKVLLAIAVLVPAPLASAQFLGRFRRQAPPTQKGRQEVNFLTSEHQRLAEIQVELALLGDLATFPYDFTARANGNTLELRGNVPNEMVRERAMDVARSTTFLRGIDALRIQPNLSVRSALRYPGVVKQEGMELLQKEIGAAAKHISFEARPNGVVVLTGRIDSVESKLEISRLLRRVPGCNAVVNQLTIEPITLEGQRMVRVTHNNMMLVPPSALGQEAEPPEPYPSPSQAREQETPPPAERKPEVPAPAPLRTSSLSVRDGDLRLPAAVVQKPPSTPTKPAAEKVGNDWEAFAPSKLPVKWGRPSGSWEAQTKELELAHSQPPATARPRTTTLEPLPKPAKLEWTPQSASIPNKTSTPIQMVGQTKPGSRPNFAEIQEKPEPVMTWKRPGGSEASEPKETATATEPRTPQAGAAAAREQLAAPSPGRVSDSDNGNVSGTSPASGASQRSARRWPAAYVTAPPPGQGHTGVVSFDDDAPSTKPAGSVMTTSRSTLPDKPALPVMTTSRSPAPAPASTAIATPRFPVQAQSAPARIAQSQSVAAAELQRKVKWICGRHAREVTAIMQQDGIVLVRVRVADLSAEERLSPKILSIPEMNSPQVRLMMEVGP